MKIIPAIDLRDGGVVRLRQGDFAQTRHFDHDAVTLARRYADALKPVAGRDEAGDAMRDVLGAALAADDLLEAMLRRRGWIEWIAFASARHPVLVERLRLCAAPRTGAERIESGGVARLLDDAAIATHLAGADGAPPRAEGHDGARGDH